MKKTIVFLLICAILITACKPLSLAGHSGIKTIVVTYSILGSVVKDLVGTSANVVVLIPNGQDPH